MLAGPAAAALRYRISGGDDAARANVSAYLGEAPADRPAAERLLATARQRAEKALQAIGIYDYAIDMEVDREASPWRLRLHLEHGEAVRYERVDSRLSGPGADDAQLQAVLRERAPRVDSPLHHGDYERFKEALLRRARERGYFDARFTVSRVQVDASRGSASAQLHFATGERRLFGAVEVPAAQLAPRRLEALLPFRAGDPYLESQLQELRGRLLHLGYFSSVVVTPEPASAQDNRVPIDLDLLDAPRHSFEVGAGYSTDTRERLSLSWHSPRLNRWGHSQHSFLRYSPVNPAARATYSIPLDARANDLLQLGGRLEENEFGDLLSRQRELSLGRERRRGERVGSLSLRALREDWEVSGAQAHAGYLLFGASLSRRHHRGDPVDPSRGLSLYGEVEAGAESLGSRQDLGRALGRVTALRRFGEHSRVVARLQGGLLLSDSQAPGTLPPSLAFFAGGDSSLRGFAYQSIGPTVAPQPGSARVDPIVVGGSRLLTGSIEYQRYLHQDWRAAVFIDAGDAFNDRSFEVNAGAGIGVHYLSPLGALRLEVAHPVAGGRGGEGWRLHINIGAEF